MRITGKIFGALTGLLFGQVAGFFFGGYLGHMLVDKRRDIQDMNREFMYGTFAVMGHIAKSAGRVTPADIALANQLMDQFRLRGVSRDLAQQAYSDGKQETFPLQQTLSDLTGGLFWGQNLARVFLEIQIQAALSNGPMDIQQSRVLESIAHELGFSKEALKQLIEMLQSEFVEAQSLTLAQAQIILGIDEMASFAQGKRAYRRLMSQHHPDKLASQGLPPEMANVAHQKAQDIQAAWEVFQQYVKDEPGRVQ